MNPTTHNMRLRPRRSSIEGNNQNENSEGIAKKQESRSSRAALVSASIHDSQEVSEYFELYRGVVDLS